LALYFVVDPTKPILSASPCFRRCAIACSGRRRAPSPARPPSPSRRLRPPGRRLRLGDSARLAAVILALGRAHELLLVATAVARRPRRPSPAAGHPLARFASSAGRSKAAGGPEEGDRAPPSGHPPPPPPGWPGRCRRTAASHHGNCHGGRHRCGRRRTARRRRR
jgi:hypothetical protein